MVQRGEQRGERVAAGELVDPVGADEEQRVRAELTAEGAQQVEGVRVGPVQVVEH